LQKQHIEVGVADAPLALSDGHYPAGSYVVLADQPYRNYAVDLLTPQHYPKDAKPPYDDVSWELPAYYHLKAYPTADRTIQHAQVTRLAGAPRLAGHVGGDGPVYLLADTGQESFLEARFDLARYHVEIAERPFRVDGVDYPQGSWILPAQTGLAHALARVAGHLDLDFASTARIPAVARHEAPVPRLGLWVPWADTDSIGWIRYSLDRRHIPYTYVRDEDIRAGHLRSKFDVLLYGRVDLELAAQIHGLPKAWGPMPYEKTPQTPNLGTPASSKDITGGIGWRGMAQLQRFVDHGGLFITLSSGSLLPIEGGMVQGIRRVPGLGGGGGGGPPVGPRAAPPAGGAGGGPPRPRPRATRSRRRPAPRLACTSSTRTIRSRTATRWTPPCSARARPCTRCRGAGWTRRTARPVSTVRSTPVTW
jgi:hypothetical protein